MMLAKKDILARALGLLGLPDIRLRLSGNQTLTILAYHRVMDIPKNYLFDRELISASCRDFEWQVNYLKKYCSPISFADFIAYRKHGKPLPRNPVIITFDDGFSDNYSNAFPILKAANVPATFFVTTDYLDKPYTFWFDWVTYLINTMSPGRYCVGDNAHIIDISDAGMKGREPQIKRFLDFLKNIPDENRTAVIDELSDLSGMNVTDSCFDDSKPMTWQQVREMSGNGMEIGSHTRSHPILSRLPKERLEAEILGSKQDIEEKLGKPVPVLAYPAGRETAYNATVMALTEEAGYQLACTYRSGVNRSSEPDSFALRRLHVEHYMSRSMFRAMLAWPALFS